MSNIRILKRAVIKEEFVALTEGDITQAVLLNQGLYWADRTNDAARFWAEERTRMEAQGEQMAEAPGLSDLQAGWFYKSAEEWADEIMLGSPDKIRRALVELVKRGWFSERPNPRYKWDRTRQYRVDVIKIASDLAAIGYRLEGYAIGADELAKAIPIPQNAECIPQNEPINSAERSNRLLQSAEAIPENTTEITSDTAGPNPAAGQTANLPRKAILVEGLTAEQEAKTAAGFFMPRDADEEIAIQRRIARVKGDESTRQTMRDFHAVFPDAPIDLKKWAGTAERLKASYRGDVSLLREAAKLCDDREMAAPTHPGAIVWAVATVKRRLNMSLSPGEDTEQDEPTTYDL